VSDAVYRKTEIVGSVTKIRGYIGEAEPEYVQVTMKVGFKLDQ
jgi:flavin-binding protein dodecin